MALDFGRLTLGAPMRLFAVAMLYARPGEPGFTIRAVFDRKHVESFGPDGAPISTRRAQLGVRLAGFPAGFIPGQGDEVAVAFDRDRPVDLIDPLPPHVTIENFVVSDVQEDGGGGATLILGARTPDTLT